MFYLIEITNYNNGTAVSKGVYEYADQDSAIATYHQRMAGAMRNETYASELLVILTNTGSQVLSDYWVRSVSPEE